MLGLAVLELGKLPTTEAELQALQVTPGWPTSHRAGASIQSSHHFDGRRTRDD
jgi:hypothetical protein